VLSARGPRWPARVGAQRREVRIPRGVVEATEAPLDGGAQLAERGVRVALEGEAAGLVVGIVGGGPLDPLDFLDTARVVLGLVGASGPQIAPALPSLAGNPMNAEFRFYACLANIAVGNPPEAIEPMRAELARYAEVCPHNYGPMLALVEAELARVRGDVAGAIARYDAAIDGAAATGSLKVEILGHQLAAQWWLARDRAGFAALHLAEARDRCELWGAHPHARALELRARELGGTVQGVGSTHSRPAVATTLDFAAVVKASNTLANDLVLDSLLAKIMAIIVENTGAQSGAIVLESGGELLLHVSWQGGRAVTVPGGAALAAARDLPEGIVRYVTRTAEHLVLDDASRHPTFRADPYVRERRPRSVLCMPIVHNERVLGAVYLENNLLVAAFTLERLEALGIILSQLAISIQNALMFARLAAYRDHLFRVLAMATLSCPLVYQPCVRAPMASSRMDL
jgi:hypothetical protein